MVLGRRFPTGGNLESLRSYDRYGNSLLYKRLKILRQYKSSLPRWKIDFYQAYDRTRYAAIQPSIEPSPLTMDSPYTNHRNAERLQHKSLKALRPPHHWSLRDIHNVYSY